MSERSSTARRRGLAERLWYGYARLVVALRWFVIVGWAAAAAAAMILLPPLGTTADDLEALGADDASFAAEQRSVELFGFPLLSRVAMVQHDPAGMTTLAQAEAVLRGIAVNQDAYDTALLGAIPIPNAGGAFPGALEEDTAVVTFLFAEPTASFFEQTDVAKQFAEDQLTDAEDAYVGVTGSMPARAAQGRVVNAYVPVVELTTLLAVLTVVALTFRSLAAPAVTLVSVGAAVGVTMGVAGSVADALDFSVPADLRPLIVALLLGVVTDYCIFYLSGLRARLAEGHHRLEAARLATASFTPIVTVAGLTVAAGTASLVVAGSALFSGFGPGLAVTVLTGVVVAITLVPAILAVLGPRAFWPSDIRRALEREAGRQRSSALTSTVTHRASAVVVAALCIAGLGLAASQVRHMDLGLGFVQSLPAESEVARAAEAAGEGFAPGIVSPTELLVEGDGVGEDEEAVSRLGEALQAQPGVAGVLGPGDSAAADDLGVLVAESGDAVRYLVVLDTTPLEATAIDNLRGLRENLPDLTAEAGLDGVTTSLAGDTALADGIVKDTTDDLLRISVAALAVNLLMLVIFLRALVAPLYLLASSVLALGATLGITVMVFQGVLGHDDLTFYVPFAAAVLLLSLGSDYNIFAVGRVWQLARDRSLRDAMLAGVPQSTRAITAAGLALASSFGLLALVPLRPFRELGFVLAVGILIDVFVVRALLVPSLLTIVGTVSSWPSRQLRRRAPSADAAAEPWDADPGRESGRPRRAAPGGP
ncbi:MMPL family transporter [Georgenia muralis]|uniref:RND superfamily putative drug exporter n=1 Tax=Georgenia muralis TaxID=154117 RepID=A0A3N4ZA02_9MICO|nr:MMPL family transporter [Georgenia muralis]RPF28746.1 RND superfamily putative drug exporter [Georgenia muralis]